MANNPQKSKDATEEALSAIQEALNTRPPDSRSPSPTPLARAEHPADLFNEEQQEPGWTADESAPRRAANDDRASIGQILQTLHGKPTRLPYILATAAAVIWAVGALITVALYWAELQAVLAAPRTSLAAVVALVGAVGAPIAAFYVLAHMFRRAHDLRLVAEFDGRSGDPPGAAGDGSGRIDRHRRSGHPSRGRRHGRRRRAGAGARRRT